MTKRKIHMFVFDRFEMLDAIGPLEAFSNAEMIAGNIYEVELVSRDGGPVRSTSGLTTDTTAMSKVAVRPDTFLVSGGTGVDKAATCPETIRHIRESMQACRRSGSVCTGAFLTAETGLLDGSKVSTHWNWGKKLAAKFPAIEVVEDPIFLRTGSIWTSAGVTAGIDMALAMIEEDHGASLALRTAQELVVYLRRPGNQSQFSTELKAQKSEEPSIQRVLRWITENPGHDMRVETLADIAGMSPRNFSRVFLSETGLTPAAFVTDIRIAKVCRLLESTQTSIDKIAVLSGFRTDDVMRRVFVRQKGCSPSEYRNRFGALV